MIVLLSQCYWSLLAQPPSLTILSRSSQAPSRVERNTVRRTCQEADFCWHLHIEHQETGLGDE